MEPLRKFPQPIFGEPESQLQPQPKLSLPGWTAVVLGFVFLAIGMAGFFYPTLLGAHLSVAHNVIHLVSGMLSIAAGLREAATARNFCLVFGSLYGLLGIFGFLFGAPSSMELDANLLRVIPNVLELGTHDHLIHIALGGIYLFAGLWKRKV